MSTTNSRINITMPPEIAAVLKNKADKHKVSVSRMALNLIVDAMERDEDIYFSELSDKRLSETKEWLSHEEVWG